MKISLINFVLFICLIIGQLPAQKLHENVNTFIGTDGHGHTYPGASFPFGMVQLSPDTRLTGWDGCSAYHFSDSIIYGFSHTHLSGTGCSDYGDILFMPYSGDIDYLQIPENGKWIYSTFSHNDETAEPGYYKVNLKDENIDVELTTSQRAGAHLYNFNGKQANVFLDLEHRDQVIESQLEILGKNKIQGYRISKAWAAEQHVYFYAEFSKDMAGYDILIDDKVIKPVNLKKFVGKNIKAAFKFRDEDELMMKIGISAVSTENAKENLEKEIAHWDFKKTKNEAQNAWNKELGKITIKGGTPEQQTIFYTALYHSFLNPNLFMDVNGEYRGRDLKVHKAKDFENFTVFSLWDTYRATHPLFVLLQKQRTIDFIKTFIAQFEQGGELPVWELAANETDCMIGYHSVSVIADSYIKGIKGFDVEKAYEAMKSAAVQDDRGLKFYKEFGYLPGDKESESVSKTLEYAYDDWCIAQMAKALKKDEDYKLFSERGQYFKNIYDPESGFMRAKLNGLWQSPFDPKEVNFHFTEANSWQYSFYAPQDITGLIEINGGNDVFEKKLDMLFSENSETTGREQADITGLVGQYAHGNEPSHHMAYLYNFIGKPWKTQKLVRHIMDELYTSEADGLCGNEDCGQMSSWYVFSALGFYPVTPGKAEYIIGTPIFPEATLNFENGRKFTVKAANVSEKNIYIQNATLNGKEYTKSYLNHEDLVKGGMLELTMGEKPNESWGVSTENIPETCIEEHKITPVPYFVTGSKTFKDKNIITIECIDKEAQIYYSQTLKGKSTAPVLYETPIEITNSAEISVYAKNPKYGKSKVVTVKYYKVDINKKVTLISEPGSLYTGSGPEGLIDGIRGEKDFRLGEWQGYFENDFEAIIELKEKQKLFKLSAGFLQDQNSWIFMPSSVEYYASNDGVEYSKVAVVKNDILEQEDGTILKNFTAAVNIEYKFIKVVAKNIGLCPQWHKGYEHNGKTWVFIDEIIIE